MRGPALPLHVLAAQPWWRMLDDKDAFYRLFSMAFMLLDMNFVQSGASAMHGFSRVLEDTRLQMQQLLQNGPPTVEVMWLQWCELRQQRQRELAEARMRAEEEQKRQAELAKVSTVHSLPPARTETIVAHWMSRDNCLGCSCSLGCFPLRYLRYIFFLDLDHVIAR